MRDLIAREAIETVITTFPDMDVVYAGIHQASDESAGVNGSNLVVDEDISINYF